MIRVRFKVECEDYRPVKWPIKHPYWCIGSYLKPGPRGKPPKHVSVLVAYAESVEEIKENWPDAKDLDVMEENTTIKFSGRFPRPDWYIDQLLQSIASRGEE